MPLLNPCPICGKQPVTQCVEEYRVQYKLFCGVHVSVGDWFLNTEAAEKDWNRRTTDQMQPDLYKSTNADRIRAMSDEEMAESRVIKLEGIAPCPLWVAMDDVAEKQYLSKETAVKFELGWLSQPVEED